VNNSNQLTSKTDGQLEQAIAPSSISLYGVFPVVEDESLDFIKEKEEDTITVGYIASTFLSTVVTVEQSLHFYKKLLVTSLVELDPQEVHNYSSIIIKAGGVLAVKCWDGSTPYSGILSLLIVGSLLIEADGEIPLPDHAIFFKTITLRGTQSLALIPLTCGTVIRDG
jgi:hypothetical protein